MTTRSAHIIAGLSLAVTLSWQDNSFNELGFNIQKTISGNCADGWYDVARTGVDITSWVDNLGQPGDCYRVNAYNSDGVSTWSNVAQVPPVVVQPPPRRCKGKGCNK